MRDIKFRAWDKMNKCMFDLYLCSINKKGEEIKTLNDFIKEVQEDGSVVMQFTGLADKNGKEIYEGDIVKIIMKWEDDRIGLVKWIKNETMFSIDVYDMGLHSLSFSGSAVEGIKIIGNLYENPELKEYLK